MRVPLSDGETVMTISPPLGVNFTALLTRLDSACSRRTGSTSAGGTTPSCSTLRVMFERAAATAKLAVTRWTSARTGVGSSVIVLETISACPNTRRSSISRLSRWAFRSTISNRPRSSSDSVPFAKISSTRPRIDVVGALNSCAADAAKVRCFEVASSAASWASDIDACTSSACAARAFARVNKLANTATFARSSPEGTGEKMKSTAPCTYRSAFNISSLRNDVTKMIGVISDCRRCRMSAAVSKPSITGMHTSRRITAKSSAMTQRSAANPESASTIR
jgi:hypothetical protein